MHVGNWDPARARYGFNYLEAFAFAEVEAQPLQIVQHGTEAQIEEFELRLSCLPSKYLLIMLKEATIEVAHQVGRVIGHDADDFIARWRAWKWDNLAVFFVFNENTPKDILANHIIYRYRVYVSLL